MRLFMTERREPWEKYHLILGDMGPLCERTKEQQEKGMLKVVWFNSKRLKDSDFCATCLKNLHRHGSLFFCADGEPILWPKEHHFLHHPISDGFVKHYLLDAEDNILSFGFTSEEQFPKGFDPKTDMEWWSRNVDHRPIIRAIYCADCETMFSPSLQRKECDCGRVWAQVAPDGLRVRMNAFAVPVGIRNFSLQSAIENRPERGPGERFEAFVLQRDTPLIIVEQALVTTNTEGD